MQLQMRTQAGGHDECSAPIDSNKPWVPPCIRSGPATQRPQLVFEARAVLPRQHHRVPAHKTSGHSLIQLLKLAEPLLSACSWSGKLMKYMIRQPLGSCSCSPFAYLTLRVATRVVAETVCRVGRMNACIALCHCTCQCLTVGLSPAAIPRTACIGVHHVQTYTAARQTCVPDMQGMPMHLSVGQQWLRRTAAQCNRRHRSHPCALSIALCSAKLSSRGMSVCLLYLRLASKQMMQKALRR